MGKGYILKSGFGKTYHDLLGVAISNKILQNISISQRGRNITLYGGEIKPVA